MEHEPHHEEGVIPEGPRPATDDGRLVDEAAQRAWLERRNQEDQLADEAHAAMERAIEEGMARAQAEDRNIDDVTAGHIARLLTDGRGALDTFAETGAVLDGIDDELDRELAESPESEPAVAALRAYFTAREDNRGEVAGWRTPGGGGAERQPEDDVHPEAREAGEQPELDIEFGQLSLMSVQGVS
jgi:hypothetical protein